MATLGLAFHDAVNEVLEAIGEYPVADPTGGESGTYSGIADRAKTFLAREKIRILALGWPENTYLATTATSGSPPSDSLWVQASGADAHRTFSLGDGAILDMNDGGATISVDVTVDAVVNLDWADIPARLKDLIVASAKLAFNRAIIGNPQTATMYTTEYALAEARATRNEVRTGPQLPNLRSPLTPQQDAGQ